jgi:hypothetical protein
MPSRKVNGISVAAGLEVAAKNRAQMRREMDGKGRTPRPYANRVHRQPTIVFSSGRMSRGRGAVQKKGARTGDVWPCRAKKNARFFGEPTYHLSAPGSAERKRQQKEIDRKLHMKTIAKLSLVLAAFTAFAGSAFAGDPSARWQSELQRQQQAERNRPVTTVAVYSKGGLGNRVVANQPAETHVEVRTNAHGQTTGAYVPGSK